MVCLIFFKDIVFYEFAFKHQKEMYETKMCHTEFHAVRGTKWKRERENNSQNAKKSGQHKERVKKLLVVDPVLAESISINLNQKKINVSTISYVYSHAES